MGLATHQRSLTTSLTHYSQEIDEIIRNRREVVIKYYIKLETVLQ